MRQPNNCRRCGKPCEGRLSWHPECVHLHKLAYWQGYAAAQLWQSRPHVCVGCWINLDVLKELCWAAIKTPEGRTIWDSDYRGWRTYGSGAVAMLNVLLRENGFNAWPRSLWEADHIVPRVEGGSELGLDNLRILCVPCHKAETRKLAQRRARARREKTQPVLALAINATQRGGVDAK